MKKMILFALFVFLMASISYADSGFAKKSGFSRGDVMPVLPYYSRLTRPASGAKAGSMLIHGGATNEDCGNLGDGTVISVCYSDGSNWVPL